MSGEGVGLLKSIFKVIGYCLQQFAFVGLHSIYHHVICVLSMIGQ